MLRKLTALVLTVSMLAAPCAPALADAIRLPASLKQIDEEAFYRDYTATEVYIPEGAESIGERAFAWSDELRVYIPDSVIDIANNAFEGASVTIVSSADSYAKYFYDAHLRYNSSCKWEDASPLTVDEVIALAEDPGEAMEPLETLEYCPTEGIDDPEQLAEAEEYNRLVDEVNRLIGECNGMEQEMRRSAQEDFSFPDFGMSEDGGAFRFDTGDLSVSMDAGFLAAMGGGASVDDIVTAADGSATLKLSSGDTYYLSASDGDLRLSRQRQANKLRAVRNGGAASLYDRLVDAIDNVTALFTATDDFIRNKIAGFNTQCGALQLKINDLEREIERQRTWRQDTSQLTIQAERLQKQKDRIAAKRASWNKGLKVWAAINIGADILALTQIISRWGELNKISAHGHPNDDDYTPGEAYAMATRLHDDIQALYTLYAVDGIACAAQIVSGITVLFAAIPTGGAATVAKVVIALLKTAMSLILNAAEDRLYDAIQDTHPLLHTYFEGEVTDDETGEPLAGVAVDADGFIYYTNETGDYKARILDREPHTFTFSLDEYKKDGFTATPNVGYTSWQSMKLSRLKGNVCGHVYNEKTGEPVAGVRIYSGERIRGYGDADGFYTAEIPLPNETVIFKADGYREKEVTLTPSLSMTVEWDVRLTPYPGVDLNSTNFPDDAFREYLRQYDLDKNAVLTREELIAIRYLTVPGDIRSVQGINYLFNLVSIKVDMDSLLETLNVSGLDYLTSIDVFSTHLAGISAEYCPRLLRVKALFSGTRADLHTLSLSNCPALQEVQCRLTSLSSAVLYNCDALTYLFLYDGKLTSLDINSLKSLRTLEVSHNSLTSLSVSGALANCLKELDVSYNRLTSLDISACMRLKKLKCKENPLSVVDTRTASYWPLSWDAGTEGAQTTVHCYSRGVSQYETDPEILKHYNDLYEFTWQLNGYDHTYYKEGIYDKVFDNVVNNGIVYENYFVSDLFNEVANYK